MEESITSTPRILSTLQTDPDLIYSTTCRNLQKLTEHILTESVENLRYISDIHSSSLFSHSSSFFHPLSSRPLPHFRPLALRSPLSPLPLSLPLSPLTYTHMDLAYSGGGLGGVTVDLAYVF